MSFTFLPNGHVQVAVLKKGTGDRFFSSSKWQKRYLDIDPETGRLEYSDKAGGPAKGDFMVRHSILTLPPPTIEAPHLLVLVRPETGAILRLQTQTHMERGALALLLSSVSGGTDFSVFTGLFSDLNTDGVPPSPIRNADSGNTGMRLFSFAEGDEDSHALPAEPERPSAPLPPLPPPQPDVTNIVAMQLHIMKCASLSLEHSLECGTLCAPERISAALPDLEEFDAQWQRLRVRLSAPALPELVQPQPDPAHHAHASSLSSSAIRAPQLDVSAAVAVHIVHSSAAHTTQSGAAHASAAMPSAADVAPQPIPLVSAASHEVTTSPSARASQAAVDVPSNSPAQDRRRSSGGGAALSASMKDSPHESSSTPGRVISSRRPSAQTVGAPKVMLGADAAVTPNSESKTAASTTAPVRRSSQKSIDPAGATQQPAASSAKPTVSPFGVTLTSRAPAPAATSPAPAKPAPFPGHVTSPPASHAANKASAIHTTTAAAPLTTSLRAPAVITSPHAVNGPADIVAASAPAVASPAVIASPPTIARVADTHAAIEVPRPPIPSVAAALPSPHAAPPSQSLLPAGVLASLGTTRPQTTMAQPLDLSDMSRVLQPLSKAPSIEAARTPSMSLRAPAVPSHIVPPAPSTPKIPLAARPAAAASTTATPVDELSTPCIAPTVVFPSRRGYGAAWSSAHSLLFTTSFNTHCVDVFNRPGPALRTVGKFGSSDGQFKDVCKCCVVPTLTGECILIVDADNNRVQQLTTDGVFVRSLGVGLLSRPHGVASDGNIIAVSESNWKHHRVSIFDFGTGELIRTIGERGAGPGQLDSPCGLAIDFKRGLVYVADSGNVRISVFTTEGAHVACLGGDLKLKWPTDVCVLSGDRLAVADTRNHRVVILSATDGTLLSSFGGEGLEPGHMKAPVALAAGPAGTLFVLDSLSDRCQQFNV